MQYKLHEHVLKGDINGVKESIADGCDFNELDSFGHSPLHWAVMGGDEDTVRMQRTAITQQVSSKWTVNDRIVYEI